MPLINIPNVGKVRFPEEMSNDDIVLAIERDILPQYSKPAPVAPERAAPFSLKDTALSLGQGVVGAGKSLTDVFGAGNVASETLESWQKGMGEAMTPERQAEIARRQQLEKQAAESGSITNEISTFLGGVAEAPVQSLAQGLGSIIPYVGTGVVGAVGKLLPATVRTLNALVGAAQGAGTIKGSVYENVEKELRQQGMSETAAKSQAAKAQEYLGANFLNIAGGMALGAWAARTGVEKLLTKEGREQAGERFLPRIGRAIREEIPAEAAQGGQEQYASNVALQRVGANVPTFQGVAGAAARDAAVAGLTAGVVGAARGPSAKPYTPDAETERLQTQIEQEQAQQAAPPAAPPPAAPTAPTPTAPAAPVKATPYAEPAPEIGRTDAEVTAKLAEILADPALKTDNPVQLQRQYKELTGEKIRLQKAAAVFNAAPPAGAVVPPVVAPIPSFLNPGEDANEPLQKIIEMGRQLLTENPNLTQEELLAAYTAKGLTPALRFVKEAMRLGPLTPVLQTQIEQAQAQQAAAVFNAAKSTAATPVAPSMEEANVDAIGVPPVEGREGKGGAPAIEAGGASPVQPVSTAPIAPPPAQPTEPVGVSVAPTTAGEPVVGAGKQPSALTPKALGNMGRFIQDYEARPGKYTTGAATVIQALNSYIKQLGGSTKGLTTGMKEASMVDRLPIVYAEFKRLYNAKVGTPAVETKPVEEAAPAVETKPVEEAAPAVETKPVEEAAPAVETKPVEEAAPAVSRGVVDDANAFVYDTSPEKAPSAYGEKTAAQTIKRIREHLRALGLKDTGIASSKDTYPERAKKHYAALSKALLDIAPKRESAASVEDVEREMGFKPTESGFILNGWEYDLSNMGLMLKSGNRVIKVPLAHENPNNRETHRKVRAEATGLIPPPLHRLFTQYDDGRISEKNLRKEVISLIRQTAVDEVKAKNKAAQEAQKPEGKQTAAEVDAAQREEAHTILKDNGIASAKKRDAAIALFTTDGVIDLEALRGFNADTDYALDASSAAQKNAAAVSKTNPKFYTARTVHEALKIVISTGNQFERLLAKTLILHVYDVKFTAVPWKGDRNVLEGLGAEHLTGADARGAYVDYFGRTGGRHVFVWGDGAPAAWRGANNVTVLHEALHAATARKITVGLASITPNSQLNILAKEFVQLMKDVDAARKKAKVSLPDAAFSNPKEFLSYGLTDERLVQFMKTLPGKRDPDLYHVFVKVLRSFFGLGSKDHNALLDFLDISRKIVGTPMTGGEYAFSLDRQAMLEAIRDQNGQEVANQVAAVNASATDKMRKNPRDVGEAISAWKTLLNSRSKQEISEVVGIMANAVPNSLRSIFLGAMTLDQIRIRAQGLNNPQFSAKVDTITKNLRSMMGERNKMLTTAGTIVEPWTALVRKSPETARRLSRVMHLATINGIDPETPEGRAASPTLAAMWDALGPDTKGSAKDIYRNARGFYKNAYDQYIRLLESNISNSNLDAEAKKKSIAALKKEFERQKMSVPYFPLMREGRYWFKSGSGKNTEYYMFESQVQRDLFVRQYMKDKKFTGSLSDIFAARPGEFDQGNTYQQLYDSFGKSSKMLQDMLTAVDASKTGDKAALKDSIYQVFLTTLPERSFRKQFVHRKNTPGFSGDALRNFGRSAFRMSSQLSRLQYGSPLLRTLEEMKGVTKGDPEKPRMDDYIQELADKADYALHPEEQAGLGDKAADIANQASFLWYLTSPASALTNLSALPVFAGPVLNARFKAGYTEVAATMGHYSKMLFSMKGMRSPDGKSYTYPSLYHALKGKEKDAFDAATANGILSQTLVADLAGLSKTPSESYTGVGHTVMKFAGSLFHASEKAMREVAFMSGYRLAKKQSPAISEEAAIERATEAMFEALGDFSATSRARYLRHPLARVMFQFKSFSQMATFYMVHNTMEAFNKDPVLRKAAITKLLGTLGMTSLFAGVTGLPLYSAIMFAFEKAFNLLKDDDEPELDAKLAFRNVLAETLNSNFVAAMVARGPIGVLLDTDVNSRIKLDDLWFRGVRQSKDEADWLRNFITDQLGPTVGLGLNAAEAMKLFGEGHGDRALERLSPAMLKNLFVANRYREEGVKTLKGDVVFAEDEVGATDIWKQAFGFAPDRVAEVTQANIAIKGMEVRIKATKHALLRELSNDLESGKDISDVLEDIMHFNAAYPTAAISGESIQHSLKARAESHALAKRGLQLAKPFRPMLGELADYTERD